MIESALTIIVSPPLLMTSLLCIILGTISFAAALQLAGIKGVAATSLKYTLAFISTESVSNLFMIILAPHEFLEYHATFNTLQITMAILLSWVLFYEFALLVKNPVRKKIGQVLKDVFTRK